MEELSAAALVALLKKSLKSVRTPEDLPVCKTRIIRKGRGFAINRQIAIHPLKDGRLHITEIP